MSLYTQTSGEGPDLVLIHGWGLHAGIWDTVVPLLEPCFRVTRIDHVEVFADPEETHTLTRIDNAPDTHAVSNEGADVLGSTLTYEVSF